MKSPRYQTDRRKRGFERAVSLVQTQIRQATESRGFAQSRLLTHWHEIVGPDVAATCRPVKVSYGKGGLGATLLLLTTGSYAPILQTQLPKIKERVNACYGYSAISRITITQTAPTGFAEGQADFSGKPTNQSTYSIAPDVSKAAHEATTGVKDDSLAQALERLGQNVLSRSKSK